MTSAAEEIQDLVESYVAWLRRGISAELITDEIAELTTPFLDRHNDHLQIYIRRQNGRFLLSDEGETISDLVSSGVDVSQQRRRETIGSIARGFGVAASEGRLSVEAVSANLGQRVHSLIQAMLSVNDMYVLARSRVASFFWEDVRQFLLDEDVRFTPRVKLAGKSGYDHSIDFLIPRSRSSPDRILQTVSNPTKPFVSNALFAISDSRAARDEPMTAFALLDDRDQEISPDVMDAFSAYDVRAAGWSHRAELVQELAA